MNFTHLKAFYSVVKYESFTQAARELNVSQPTLSLQVQNLEKQYDIPLLKRTKKAIELTDEGKLVFIYAEKIFALAGEMENKIEDLNSFKAGDLKIGSTPTLAHYMLPNLILKIKENNPNLKFQLYTGLSREVLGKVLDFEYHAGIIGRVEYPSNVIYSEIINPKLYFITADKMKDRIELRDLSDYPILFPERGSATREYIINEFQKKSIPLNNYIDCENASALKNMVHLGIAAPLSIEKRHSLAQYPKFTLENIRQAALINFKESLRDAASLAEAFNVVLGLENFSHVRNCVQSTYAELVDWVDEINSPALKITLDVGHANLEGGVEKAIEIFDSRIAHIHLNDNDGQSSLHGSLGSGTVDWHAIAPFLANFDGMLSLELIGFEDPEGEVLRSKAILEDLLHQGTVGCPVKPQGS